MPCGSATLPYKGFGGLGLSRTRPRLEGYSPECAEGEFSELRPEGVLGSTHVSGPMPSGLLMHGAGEICGLA